MPNVQTPEEILRSIIDGSITGFEDNDITFVEMYRFYDSNDLEYFRCHNIVTGCRSCFSSDTLGLRIALPRWTYYNGYAFESNRGVVALDLTDAYRLAGNTFDYCTTLATLVLRHNSVVTIQNVSAFNNTPFKNGGSGGTIYIPKSLYDHLDDGTSSDYKAATNWSTVNGYGTITWKSIESTHTDPSAPIDLTTHYIDGTLIPTS